MAIAISGAGLSGLALARRLEQLGFREIIIFERDESFESRQQGYSLTIQETGQAALRSLGLLEAVRACSTFGGGGQYLVAACDGRVLQQPSKAHKPRPQRNRGRANLYVPRQDLRRILLQSLQRTEIRWSQQVVSYQESEGAVKVQLSTGEVLSSGLLVACDGVKSLIRQQKLRDELKFLGVGMINGITSHRGPAQCLHGNLQLIDGTARMFLKPFQDGRAMWQLTFPVSDEKVVEKLKFCEKTELQETALRETSSWLPEYKDIIQNTDLEALRGGGLFDHDPSTCAQHSASSLVVLIGDAAHPMSPFKGQGANQALTDSILLAKMLQESRKSDGQLDLPTVGQKLCWFHHEMARRVRPSVLGSRKKVEYFHSNVINFDAYPVKG